MYPMFKKTVETLIAKVGGVSLENFYREENQHILIRKPNYDDLIIQKTGREIKVGYYRNGDYKPDPIFVFEQENGFWCPIRCEQVLGKIVIGKFENGRYLRNTSRVNEIKRFANACVREWKEYYL